MLLEQIVDALNMTIAKEKLVVIFKLEFPIILKKLEAYLNFIEWLRIYVFYYAQIAKSLQFRKILFLKNEPKKNLKKNRSLNAPC